VDQSEYIRQWNPVKELKVIGSWRSLEGHSLLWNPVKELKVAEHAEGREAIQHLWNPVKELKDIAKAISIVATVAGVESGEGIERCECDRHYGQTELVESGEGIESRRTREPSGRLPGTCGIR